MRRSTTNSLRNHFGPSVLPAFRSLRHSGPFGTPSSGVRLSSAMGPDDPEAPEDPEFAPEVAKMWCVGNLAVRMVTVADAELEGCDDSDLVDMLALDLTSRDADFNWAETALRLRGRSFRRIQWPLLEEIRGLASTWRREQAAKIQISRASVRPHLVIGLHIRNFHLHLLNNPRKIRIMIFDTEVESTLRWLLSEFRKDLDNIDDVYKLAQPTGKITPIKGRRPSSPKTPLLPVPVTPSETFGRKNSEELLVIPEEEQIRNAVLSRLQTLLRCRGAYWVRSRNALLVVPQEAGKGRKHFGVQRIAKIRKQYWRCHSPEVVALIRNAYGMATPGFRRIRGFGG